MDQHQPQRRLSEISHLFLSDVRARQTNNAPPPVRKPPGTFKGDVSIDLTPEEFAQVFADGNDTDAHAPVPSAPVHPTHEPTSHKFKPVQAIIAHHLGELMADRVRDIAGMICQDGARVGVIYADASDLRVCCVEHNPSAEPAAEDDLPAESLDAQRLEEVIVELNQDIAQWLIVLPDHRSADSRSLLRQIAHWTLVTGVDHDGVVSSYRTIKGLAEGAKPHLAITVFGAIDEHELDKTHRKLASVCEQFLHMKPALLGAVEPGDNVVEHVVLNASAAGSTMQIGSAPQWKVLSDLVRNAASLPIAAPVTPSPATPSPVVSVPVNKPVMRSIPVEAPRPVSPIASAAPVMEDGFTSIIDLPQAEVSASSIVQAVIRGGNNLIETPIKSPHHADAVIAVSRDHHLVLVSVAKQGLSDLRMIGQTYRWMSENRALIAMALPQFAIEAHAMPRLELLVDHADVTADVLQPLLDASHVSVRAYRKLKWSGKTGLLLEAA